MQPPVNEALADLVRQVARPTTPAELARRGATLRSVSLRQISTLIEQAVNRTLLARTIGVDPGEMQALLEGARGEFLSMLEAGSRLDSSRATLHQGRASLESELSRLREELRGGPPTPLPAADGAMAAEEERRLAASLREAFAVLEPQTPALLRVEREVLARALEALRASRLAARAAWQAERQEEVRNLERRIAKLVSSLETAELAISRLAAAKDVEEGIASLYRRVQGLAVDAPHLELKRALLAEIFRANEALQGHAGTTVKSA
jgi:hypothetical protein